MSIFNGPDGEKEIKKPLSQKYKEAVLRIGSLERQVISLNTTIDELKWALARRQAAINALGSHYELTPEAMKAIIEDYMKAQEAEYLKQTEEAKEKFKADLAAGKVPEFKVINNTSLEEQPPKRDL